LLGAQNNLDFSEGAVLTANADKIQQFVSNGGSLMGHSGGPIGYGEELFE
jgi:hypothetical protein